MRALIESVQLNGKKTNVLVNGNKIESIGEKTDRSGKIINGENLAIIPGFVNAHTHAAMSLLRGFADDYPLQEWLEKYIWPREKKLNKKDVYWGTKLACLEMVKSGTTCFSDMYFHSKQTAKAVEEAGIRGYLSEVFLGKTTLKKTRKNLKELKKFSERIQPMLGPHALYTVSGENLKKIAELAREKNLLIHFHLSETEKEVKDCIREHGKRPVEYLDELNFLSERLISAHSVWLNEREIKTLAENGVKVVHCPVSNMKLAVGKAMPYKELKSNGVQVCLGTDGCASNNSLSMLGEMKFASLLQKHSQNNTTTLPVQEVFSIATRNGASALGLNAGEIREGMLADFSLVDLNNLSLSPGHNLFSDLVYSAESSCIETVFCNGEIVMENSRVKGEEKIIEKAKEQAKKWVSR